jgi:S-adenosylmethionine-diacylgycerolhomoserine-N-methlytransferase
MPMSLSSELKILYHMLLAPIRGHSHAERLDSFYRGQAQGYDAFRERLLHGRGEMWRALPLPEHGLLIDMGGGTGANLLYLDDALAHYRKVYIVDLAISLLQVARQRVQAHGWHHVVPVAADATTFVPPEAPVDVITFSYSLTMIPDWFKALDHAWKLLRPGGIIGVVDFYVSRKYPPDNQERHGWLTRTFWPLWFAFDNVFPNPDHIPYLHHRFEPVHFAEHRARMPYMPGVRVPYYHFIGRKPPHS